MITVFHFNKALPAEATLAVTSPMDDMKAALLKRSSHADCSDTDKAKIWEMICEINAELRIEAATALFVAGGYEAVAEVEGTDLEVAFNKTQNVTLSWSLDGVDGLTARQPNFVTAFDGRRVGRGSTSVGHLMECDGRFYIVSSDGFVEIPAMPVLAAA